MNFKDAFFAGTFTPGAALVFRLTIFAVFAWALVTDTQLITLAVFYLMFEWRNHSVEYMAVEVNHATHATGKLTGMLTKASLDISGLYHIIENLQGNQELTDSQKKLLTRYGKAVAEMHSEGSKTPWELFEEFVVKEGEGT